MTIDQDRLLPLPQVSDRLGGCSRQHLYDLRNRGLLTFVKQGRRTFVRESDLADYIARLPVAAFVSRLTTAG